MASTSASSVQKRFKYDVFLSFRGEDTRKTFVDHIFHALDNKGIITYKDDERIEKGGRIDDQLIRSIEDSRFHIIVFSKNYASSSWCLDELVKIMECWKMTEHTVYPVFYDVEPTEVRNQSGIVGEAFEWSTRKRKLENEDDVGRWRNALKEAACLAGMELKNTFNGHEAKFIQKIVEEISLKIDFFNSSIDGKLVGMETRVRDVVSSLDLDSDDVLMIGIKGMGGGGKTTLARAVFDHISIRFEGKSFVEDVREGSTSSGLKKLQKKVIQSVLNDKNIKVESVHDGKCMMKRMMYTRKVLIVLDDVDDIGQLEALAGEPTWFKPGSRIIITTRDEQVLKAHQVNFIHNINLLSHEEATCLFNRYAFGREIPNHRYVELSRMIVHYSAGLPLTIKVLGSFLYGRIEGEWEDVIERLKKIPLKETLEKLELSFNSLENDQKEIFLDIACILKGTTKKKAIRILKSCGFHAQIGLRVLEQKSMISISKGDSNKIYDNYVDVDDVDDVDGVERFLLHDHLEEMGMNIVRRLHPNEPKRHSRLWIEEEIKDILVNESGTEDTKCLKLKNTNLNPTIVMKGLGKMKELRLLYMHGSYHEHVFDELNEVSQYLPDSLQSLSWHKYPFCCLPKTFRPNKLVNLEMTYSNISELWEGAERKVLNKLKFLDLKCSKLRTFDLTVTPHLEELNLKGCDDFVQLHMPVKCSNLKILTLSGNKGNLNLGMTPHLEKLILYACKEFELHMPVECPKLYYLKLTGSKVSMLNLGLTPNLQRLHLIKCCTLQEIHAPTGSLKKLVYFCLESCLSFVYFHVNKQLESTDLDSVATIKVEAEGVDICKLHPKNNSPYVLFKCEYDEHGSSWSGNLEKLISSASGLCACKNLEYPATTICGLQHLRQLTLGRVLLVDLRQLQSLEKLCLGDVDTQHLPDIPMLKHLKSLVIRFCMGIEQLPENICRLERLDELYIYRCPSLRGIPNTIYKMKCLERLHFPYCVQLEILPEELGCLECLKELNLVGCKSLRDIPNSICNIKCLQSLKLSFCIRLEKLPEELGCLGCLKELNIEGAEGISHLPQSIYQLKGLRIVGGSREQLQSYGFTSVSILYPGSISPWYVEL